MEGEGVRFCLVLWVDQPCRRVDHSIISLQSFFCTKTHVVARLLPGC